MNIEELYNMLQCNVIIGFTTNDNPERVYKLCSDKLLIYREVDGVPDKNATWSTKSFAHWINWEPIYRSLE